MLKVFNFLVVHISSSVSSMFENIGGGLAQWLGRRISGQGVPGSSPGLAQFVVALSKSHLPLA